MKRSLWSGILASIIAMGLIAGSYIDIKEQGHEDYGISTTVKNQGSGQTLQYLGQEYKLPAKVSTIAVTGALEALEDMLLLDVKPAGVMTVGGVFPAMFAGITQDAVPIGERMQPSFEAMLKVKPDVILSSDKFAAATTAQFKKIAPTIPISHFPANAAANLRLLGELTGRQQQAEAALEKYYQDVAVAKKRLPEQVRNKKVVAIRIRKGNICVYPVNLFFNEILYAELGLPVPAEIQALKGGMQFISLERFSEMDPDYIFLQYESSESREKPQAVAELQQNPIWRSMKAAKTDKVFINVVDPLIQGVAIGGKLSFLDAVVERLAQ